MRFISVLLVLLSFSIHAEEKVKYVETPYKEPRVVFDFYFDDPDKINPALYWIRSLINPLTEEPYGYAPEFMDIKVVIHGTEIVTVAKKNYKKYKETVDWRHRIMAISMQTFMILSRLCHRQFRNLPTGRWRAMPSLHHRSWIKNCQLKISGNLAWNFLFLLHTE
jgi:hypothetical protein